MYLDFFDIKETPFSITPDPRYLYLSPRHQEALAHLLYAVTGSGGFVMLSGEVGAGKTTLCRSFLEHVPDDVDIALIVNPRLDELELMLTILDELSIVRPPAPHSLKTTFDALNAYLIEAHAKNRRTVLIIDEAQNLSASLLELIRLLTNLETAKTKLLQIILIGQPELETILARSELRQISQRITARYALRALNRKETGKYIHHRLEVAGLAGRLFTDRAIGAVYRHSQGVPRLINTVCDRALLGAYVGGRQKIDVAIVKKAIDEVGRGPSPRRYSGYLGGAVAIGVILLGVASWLFAPQQMDRAIAYTNVHAILGDLKGWAGNGLATLNTFWTADFHGGETSPPLPSSVVIEAPTHIYKAPPSSPTPVQEEHVMAAPTAPDSETPKPTPETIQNAQKNGLSQTPLKLPSKQRAERTLNNAYVTLFRAWGKDYARLTGFSPCEKAALSGLSCLRGQGGLADLDALNLPALVRLEASTSPESASVSASYAIVTAMDRTQVSLSSGSIQDVLPRPAFRALWDGNYLLLWPVPKGVRPILRQGMRGNDVIWLRSILARTEGSATIEQAPPPPADAIFDDSLVRRVRVFQRTHALPVDGVAGPQTIARLLGLLGWNHAPVLHPSRTSKEPQARRQTPPPGNG
ncbi:ExeA family protein [Varunaivibrio sulfuroxidans]|uniref:General secretion pathway protein A n=1 Tax=Varunaivibrio sulfuroxidans TaxID=1773489 RepID=A0A4R3JE76_9PROT|nr:ExeA family protein [Varunaivibrio sulfuroxidans]TCS64358.1 general secretion pathway protein A [Varunaivibrio sulfuroxidans]WES31206.1 AAA family ATPase [Varunaivibrio sulfuroxidans]